MQISLSPLDRSVLIDLRKHSSPATVRWVVDFLRAAVMMSARACPVGRSQPRARRPSTGGHRRSQWAGCREIGLVRSRIYGAGDEGVREVDAVEVLTWERMSLCRWAGRNEKYRAPRESITGMGTVYVMAMQ